MCVLYRAHKLNETKWYRYVCQSDFFFMVCPSLEKKKQTQYFTFHNILYIYICIPHVWRTYAKWTQLKTYINSEWSLEYFRVIFSILIYVDFQNEFASTIRSRICIHTRNRGFSWLLILGCSILFTRGFLVKSV